MAGHQDIGHGSMDRFTPALEAIRRLFEKGFSLLDFEAGHNALTAHTEIEHEDISRKQSAFFRHFIPLRQRMVALLADTYRKYFKLALANGRKIECDPDIWAWDQLQPAVNSALEWMREWYVLACDGENQRVRRVGSVDFTPGQMVSFSIPMNVLPLPASWHAPAWLFGLSATFFGVGRLKDQNIPSSASEQRLTQGHTRLLHKGARRVFLWELANAIETVQSEETAEAGAIPSEPPLREANPVRNTSARPHKGTDGLPQKKLDFSQYMDGLTAKQRLACSLKYEYELGLGEIASRMGVDRKTAYEHIAAAEKKIQQSRSREKRSRPRFENRGE